MRLNGEEDEEEREREEEVSMALSNQRLVVGYALTSKKKLSFLQPKLLGLARLLIISSLLGNLLGLHNLEGSAFAPLSLKQNNKGIVFVAIDRNRPLSDQGPFDVVLHKLSGKEWCQTVEDFRLKHPEVTVLDPPYAIEQVYNRQSMLENVASLDLPDCHGKVGVPRQLVITKDPLSIPDEVNKAGFKLPLVIKPLVVDGSAKSHQLFLAYDQSSLSKLEPPLVVQEFVNHGGVLFKVHIIGETIQVSRRFSLPDVCRPELSKIAGLFPFPRVSSAAASADGADLDPTIAELPPAPLLEKLAKELRGRLGLRLFNIDMIRENGTKDVYYIIDINYFPGYGKMPEYEHIFTDFLLDLMPNKRKKWPAS